MVLRYLCSLKAMIGPFNIHFIQLSNKDFLNMIAQ